MKRILAVVCFLCAVSLLLFFLPVAGTTQGQTIDIVYVSQDDPTCGGNAPCYTSIQAAIDAIGMNSAPLDSSDTSSFNVRITKGSYPEDLALNDPVNIDLEGGWDSDFTSQTSSTYIDTLTIGGDEGTLSVANIVIGSPSGPPTPIEGTYSGTYSGTDYGTWTVRCDSQGNLIGVSWSEVYGIPDAGSGTFTSSGEFVSNMDGGAILKGTIDSTGAVEGSWTNPHTGQSGTLQGRKNLPSELAVFMGKYSGTYSGIDNGTWEFLVDSSGNGSGTVWSELYQESYSGYGIINATGEITAVASSGSILHGMISSTGNVSGIWYVPSVGSGGNIWGSRILVPPAAPVLNVSTSVITARIRWSSIPDALGYTLYYASHDITHAENVSMGTKTYFLWDLWEGASFYVAVKAYNSYGSSGYSNIVFFEIPAEKPSTPGPVIDFTIDTSKEDCNSFTWVDPTDADLSHIEIWVAKVYPGIPEWSPMASYTMQDLARYEDRVYKCIVYDDPKGISPVDPVNGYQGSGEHYWRREAYPYKRVTWDAWCKALIPPSVEKWTDTLEGDELATDWYYWAKAVDYAGNDSNWRPMETRDGLLAPAKINQ